MARHFRRLIVATLTAGLAAGTANAQQPKTDSRLEEIIVTAQKREENIQDVPSSIATLSDEKLNAFTTSGADIRFLSARVPSLYVESSFGRTFPRFYIRGLGNTDFDLNASQPVSLVYDEIVLENPILKGFPVFDLERIEVLRGPQGTLFGRNTPAGIVKFDSRRPSQEFSGYVSGSYGNLGSTGLEAAFGGGLSETVSARASILHQGRSDWIDNRFTNRQGEYGGYDEVAGRLQLLYEPSDRYNVLLNVHARSLDGTARVFHANSIVSGSQDLVPGFERDQAALDGANQQEVDVFGSILRINYDFDTFSLTSITGFESASLFSRGDIDGGFGAVFAPPTGPAPGIPFTAETSDAVPDLDQFTQEIRLTSSGEGPMRWQTGVFFFDEDLNIETINYDTLAGGAVNGHITQHQDARTWAAFGSVSYDFSDRLTFTGGLRVSSDDKTFTAERTISPLSFLGVGPLAPVTVNPDDTVVGGDVALHYALNDDVNVYGRIARGFRAPSIQGRVLFGDDVTVADTETIMSYEGGFKADINGRARLNVSLFYFNVDDHQLTAVGGAQNANILLNGDKTTGLGFEAEGEFLFGERVLATLGVSYNDTQIDDPTLGVVPGAAAGITVLDPAVAGSPGVVSIDGNSLPNAPELVANMTLRYGMPLGNGELFVYTDWAYRSEVNFFLYESVEFKEDNLLEGGLRIGYAPTDGAWEVALYGRNINDDLSRTGAIDFNNLLSFVNDEPTYGLQFRKNFGQY